MQISTINTIFVLPHNTYSKEVGSEPVLYHYTLSFGLVLLGTVTAITHPIPVHSAPGLSEDIVVIVVHNPLETPAGHCGAETVKWC